MSNKKNLINRCKKYAVNGKMPRASEMRAIDSGLEAALRKYSATERIGLVQSYARGCEMLGFSTDSSKRYSLSDLITEYRIEYFADSPDPRKIQNLKRVIWRMELNMKKFTSLAKIGGSKLLSPYGFNCDSLNEIYVSKIFYQMSLDVLRTEIRIEGKNYKPDFLINYGNQKVIAEVSMSDKIPNSEREKTYLIKLHSKILKFKKYGFFTIIIYPTELTKIDNQKRLLTRIKNFLEKISKVNHSAIKFNNININFRSQVYWTKQVIDKYIDKFKQHWNGEYAPTYNELKNFCANNVEFTGFNSMVSKKIGLLELGRKIDLPIKFNSPRNQYQLGAGKKPLLSESEIFSGVLELMKNENETVLTRFILNKAPELSQRITHLERFCRENDIPYERSKKMNGQWNKSKIRKEIRAITSNNIFPARKKIMNCHPNLYQAIYRNFKNMQSCAKYCGLKYRNPLHR